MKEGNSDCRGIENIVSGSRPTSEEGLVERLRTGLDLNSSEENLDMAQRIYCITKAVLDFYEIDYPGSKEDVRKVNADYGSIISRIFKEAILDSYINEIRLNIEERSRVHDLEFKERLNFYLDNCHDGINKKKYEQFRKICKTISSIEGNRYIKDIAKSAFSQHYNMVEKELELRQARKEITPVTPAAYHNINPTNPDVALKEEKPIPSTFLPGIHTSTNYGNGNFVFRSL